MDPDATLHDHVDADAPGAFVTDARDGTVAFTMDDHRVRTEGDRLTVVRDETASGRV